MSAYNANFEVSLPPDLAADADAASAIRAAVKLPVDLRSQGVRIVLFLGAILLARDDEMRASAQNGFLRALDGYDEVHRVLANADKLSDLHPDVPAIISAGTKQSPNAFRAMTHMTTRATKVRDAIEQAGQPTQDDYDALMRIGYGELHPTVLAMGEAMAEAAAVIRETHSQVAEGARKRALSAQGRIDRIARTVRMISVNARVESARAGQAGRAFGVIAEEIKTLSEQTEVANTEMSESLEEIMESFRAL